MNVPWSHDKSNSLKHLCMHTLFTILQCVHTYTHQTQSHMCVLTPHIHNDARNHMYLHIYTHSTQLSHHEESHSILPHTQLYNRHTQKCLCSC